MQRFIYNSTATATNKNATEFGKKPQINCAAGFMFARTKPNKTGYKHNNNSNNNKQRQITREWPNKRMLFGLLYTLHSTMRGGWKSMQDIAKFHDLFRIRRQNTCTGYAAVQSTAAYTHFMCVYFVVIAVCLLFSLSLAMSCWIFALTACGYLINKQ